MTLTALLISPFSDFAFMRRALVASMAIAIGGAPLGVFLVLRRMALAGDAISHAILPGVALAFLCFGFSLTAMTLGGILAGLLIAAGAGLLSQATEMKEDASLTATYLISLAAGVLMLSLHGSSLDVMHVLFGNVLALSRDAVIHTCVITSLSTILLALIYRSLTVYCIDPGFLRTNGGHVTMLNIAFLSLVALNLVSAFAALGTLMALSVIVLPAIAARFWTSGMDSAVLFSMLVSFLSSYMGLLLSFHLNHLPSGPAIVLCAGGICLFSLLFGRYYSLRDRLASRTHFTS